MIKNYLHNILMFIKVKYCKSHLYWIIVILNKKKTSIHKQVEQLGFNMLKKLKILWNKKLNDIKFYPSVFINTITIKLKSKNLIKAWFYITIILVFLLLIYINPILLVETLAEEDVDKKISEILESIDKLNQENLSIKEDLKATHKLLKLITISLVFAMVISGYNWEAMYQLKEILKNIK